MHDAISNCSFHAIHFPSLDAADSLLKVCTLSAAGGDLVGGGWTPGSGPRYDAVIIDEAAQVWALFFHCVDHMPA